MLLNFHFLIWLEYSRLRLDHRVGAIADQIARIFQTLLEVLILFQNRRPEAEALPQYGAPNRCDSIFACSGSGAEWAGVGCWDISRTKATACYFAATFVSFRKPVLVLESYTDYYDDTVWRSDPKVWKFVHIALLLATGPPVGRFADFNKFWMGTGVDWLHFQSLKPDRSWDTGKFVFVICGMVRIADFENGECAPKSHVPCVVHCFVFGHRFVWTQKLHTISVFAVLSAAVRALEWRECRYRWAFA